MRANKDHDSAKARIRILVLLMVGISTILVASLLSASMAPKSTKAKRYDQGCLLEPRKYPLIECEMEDYAK